MTRTAAIHRVMEKYIWNICWRAKYCQHWRKTSASIPRYVPRALINRNPAPLWSPPGLLLLFGLFVFYCFFTVAFLWNCKTDSVKHLTVWMDGLKFVGTTLLFVKEVGRSCCVLSFRQKIDCWENLMGQVGGSSPCWGDDVRCLFSIKEGNEALQHSGVNLLRNKLFI